MSRSERAALILLGGLVAGLVGLHVLAVRSCDSPPQGDALLHLANSLAIHRALAEGDLAAVLTNRAYEPLHGTPPFHPPALYLVTSGFYGLLGLAPQVAAMAQLPFLVLLGGSVAWLGWRLGGPWSGLVAATAALSAPAVSYYTQNYYLDLPLAAAVALLLAVSLQADGFGSRGASVAWGAAVALGAASKNTFVFWGAVPILMTLASCARRRPADTARAVLALGAWVAALLLAHGRLPLFVGYALFFALLAFLARRLEARSPGFHLPLALATALAGCWWNLENLAALAGGGISLVGGAQMTTFPSWETKLWDLYRVLAVDSIPGLPWLLALSALSLPLQAPARRREVLWLTVSGVGALALNTAFVVTDTRYLLPVLGWLAPLAFLWVGLAPPAALPVVAALSLSWIPFAPPALREPLAGLHARAASQGFTPDPPFMRAPEGDWPDLRILQDLGQDAVLWGVSHSHDTPLQPRLFRYLALREGIPLEVVDVTYHGDVLEFDETRRHLMTHLLVITRDHEEARSLLPRFGFESPPRLHRFYEIPGGEGAWLYVAR